MRGGHVRALKRTFPIHAEKLLNRVIHTGVFANLFLRFHKCLEALSSLTVLSTITHYGANWGAEDAEFALIIGLNPSLADQHRDDPTIRRCIAFCEAWGLSRLCMVNVFAYRSTSPVKMLKSAQPLGSHSDETSSVGNVG